MTFSWSIIEHLEPFVPWFVFSQFQEVKILMFRIVPFSFYNTVVGSVMRLRQHICFYTKFTYLPLQFRSPFPYCVNCPFRPNILTNNQKQFVQMSQFLHILWTWLYLTLKCADGAKISLQLICPLKTAVIEYNLTELFLKVLLCGLRVLV